MAPIQRPGGSGRTDHRLSSDGRERPIAHGRSTCALLCFPLQRPAWLERFLGSRRDKAQADALARLEKARLPGLAALFKDVPVDKWPSIRELSERLGIDAPQVPDGEATAVQASLMCLAGHVVHGKFQWAHDRPSLADAVRASFEMGSLPGVEAVRTVLKKQLLAVDHRFEDGCTLLELTMTAQHEPQARDGMDRVLSADRVRILLECGANPNRGFSDGAPPLLHARTNAMFDTLRDHGAELEIEVTTDGQSCKRTLLQLARTKEEVRFLIEKGLGIDACSATDRLTPLLLALKEGRYDVARELIESGANVNAEDGTGGAALHCGPPGDIVELLLKKGANAQARTYNHATALHCANDARAVRALVPAMGAPWPILKTTTPDQQRDVLEEAAHRGCAEVVSELLRLDTHRNLNRKGALSVAKAPEIVAALFPREGAPLRNQAELSRTSRRLRWGADVYHLSAQQGGDKALIRQLIGESRNPSLKLLLEHGLLDQQPGWLEREVGVPGSGTISLAGLLLKDFPHDFALLRDNIERGLLDADAKDSQGRSLLFLAARFNRSLDEVRYIVEKGGDVSASGPGERTPLHLAASKGNLDVCKYLVEQGAETSVRDLQGNRPMDYASSPELQAILAPRGDREAR